MINDFEAKPTLRIIVAGDVTVTAVKVSPGLPAEFPAVLTESVNVVPDTVNVVPAAMLVFVVLSTKYIPFERPVAEETVMLPAPELKIEVNVVTRGVTVTEEI